MTSTSVIITLSTNQSISLYANVLEYTWAVVLQIFDKQEVTRLRNNAIQVNAAKL